MTSNVCAYEEDGEQPSGTTGYTFVSKVMRSSPRVFFITLLFSTLIYRVFLWLHLGCRMVDDNDQKGTKSSISSPMGDVGGRTIRVIVDGNFASA